MLRERFGVWRYSSLNFCVLFEMYRGRQTTKYQRKLYTFVTRNYQVSGTWYDVSSRFVTRNIFKRHTSLAVSPAGVRPIMARRARPIVFGLLKYFRVILSAAPKSDLVFVVRPCLDTHARICAVLG